MQKGRPTKTHPRRNQPEPRQETKKTPNRQLSDERKKKKTGAGRNLDEEEKEEVRVEVGVRVQDEETLGETQTPQGFVVPQHLRERERERERQSKRKRRRRTSQQPKTEKEDNEQQSEEGAGLKGHQTKQHLDPRDQKYHTNKPDIYPERTNKKPRTNQTESQRSVTAGWRGPWAALHFWGVTPGDRSTEGYKYPPTAGTAPGNAKANNNPNMRLIPQKLCPSTWPFLK